MLCVVTLLIFNVWYDGFEVGTAQTEAAVTCLPSERNAFLIGKARCRTFNLLRDLRWRQRRWRLHRQMHMVGSAAKRKNRASHVPGFGPDTGVNQVSVSPISSGSRW